MKDRSVLAGVGRTLVTVASVVFFTAAAFAVVASVGYALFQSSPIWTPVVVESATDSELKPTDEGQE